MEFNTAFIPDALRKKIYGVSLYKTRAVYALENYLYSVLIHGDFSKLPITLAEYFEGEERKKFGYDRWCPDSGLLSPLKEALCKGDESFFRNLADAIKKRSKPKHQDAIFVYEYVTKERLKIQKKERDELLTISEVKQEMLARGFKGNPSDIMDEDLGEKRNAKKCFEGFTIKTRGRKPKIKK